LGCPLGLRIVFVFPDDNTFNNTIASVPFIASQTVFNDVAPAAPSRTWNNFFLGQPVFTANSSPTLCSFGFAANSCATPNLYASALALRTTYLQQWNFSIQRQLTASTSVDVAYVGNKTTHLNQNWGINDPVPGRGAIQARRPYPQWGTISYPVFDENANYNALQAKLETRNSHGLSTLASYTFSKCIDSGSSQSGTTLLLVRFNRAVCDYDLPRNFSGSVDYQLPFGRGRALLPSAHGWLQQLVGGWELAGIVTLRSGQPFTPTVSGDPENTGVATRPDRVGPAILPHTVNCWFYTSANPGCVAAVPNAQDAFVAPPAQTRYGTSGRNILRGQSLKQVDFTVIKTFPFTETKRLDFRGEFFNIMNHATFSTPGTDINTSSGGQISSTLNAARIIQLALKFYF
jgi:hypothetical protein